MAFEYQFGNKVYHSLEELGREIVSSWELAKIHLQSDALARAISAVDPVLANKVEVCRRIANLDRGVFVLQYLLNNSLTFAYKGLVFEDLSKLGLAILDQAPYINERLEEVIKYGLISDFMKLKDLDVNYPKHYDAVVALEGQYENEPLTVYFSFAYLLCEDKGFRYNGRTFSDQGAFFNYLSAYRKIEDFASVPWNMNYLTAWLNIQGLSEQAKQWKAKLSTLEAWK